MKNILQAVVLRCIDHKSVKVKLWKHYKHPVYNKIMRIRSEMLVHTNNKQCQPGDTVLIRRCRPYSAQKTWVVID